MKILKVESSCKWKVFQDDKIQKSISGFVIDKGLTLTLVLWNSLIKS